MKALNHRNQAKVYILFHWNDKRKSENTKQEIRDRYFKFSSVFIVQKHPGNLSLSEMIIMFYIANKVTVLLN
jgi:hypothetical protein